MQQPPTTSLLFICLTFSIFVWKGSASIAFDIGGIEPIADSSIRTGNKALVEREIKHPVNGTLNHNDDDNDDDDDDDAVDVDFKDEIDPTDDRNRTDNEWMMDVNDIPVRFDEAQLWRIYNISQSMSQAAPIGTILENKFGGTIWKENSKFLDISIDKDHAKAARSFLKTNNLERQVLHENIQDLIDAEHTEGVLASNKMLGSRTKRASKSGMNWKDYQDLTVIYAFMREIRGKFPNICRLYTIGKTVEGRDLKVLRISENPKDYKKIWIDGGIHAREWISPATVTYILYQMMVNWENQPAYIKERTWYIMPVMNPDGYVFSRKTNRLWRKNRTPTNRANCHGVDLNRNWNIGWTGYGSSTNPCSDTYRGTSPASELETQAVVEFLTKRKYNLEAYLTFHSYGQMIVYPWAYKSAKASNAAELQRVGQTAVQRILNRTGAVYRTSVTYEILGVAGGGSDDWSKAALKVPYVYTVELRDRGNYGFVLPPGQIIETAKEGHIVVETVAQAIK